MKIDFAGVPCYGTTTTAVCSFPAGNSPFGLCDMAGNVREWCQDMYDENYYSKSPRKNPVCKEGDYRSWRGGSWDCQFIRGYNFETTVRGRDWPSSKSDYNGIRCARSQ